VLHDANGAPVGTLAVGIYRTPTGCKAWIEDVVVDHAHRGFGYGKKMVEYAIGFIRDSGADTISLTSNPSRIAANQLYQQLDFELYPTNYYKMRLSKI
jgi:GNAT superfamily N-acetyltransferase